MLKIWSTQVSGLLQRLSSKEEEVEETARLLAQAGVGDGKVYIATFGEMKTVDALLYDGTEPWSDVVRWDSSVSVEAVDRVWILSPNADHKEAFELARTLEESMIPFAVLVGDKDAGELGEMAYAVLTLGVKMGLVPTESGERIGKSSAMAIGGLFVVEAVKDAFREMVSE